MLAALLLTLAVQEDFHAMTTDEIVSVVQSERDSVDPEAFAVLAERGGEEELEAFGQCSSLLGTEEGLNRMYLAAAAMGAKETELGERTRAWFLLTANGASWVHQRPATRALASLGGLVEQELRQVLIQNGDPRCRQIACGALVPALELQADEAALEILLMWYRPPLSGPQRRLERALTRFQGKWATKALERVFEDKNRPGLLRGSVLRAIGERREKGYEKHVLKGLTDRDPTVQAAAIATTVELEAFGHLRALQKLLRADDEVVRHAALLAIDALQRGDEEWEAELLDHATEKDPVLRLAAVTALAERPAGFKMLVTALADESALVRLAAIAGVRKARRKEALEPLIGVLNGDSERLREAAHEALVALTGLDHGRSGNRWQSWFTSEGHLFELPAEPVQLVRKDPGEGRTAASFYGIRLGSDRVCFVLDTSGSMGGQIGGKTRMEAAIDELVSALEAFPVGGQLNLVFFASRVNSWRSDLTVMNEERLSQAIRYARGRRAKGGTALHDGLVAAFEDPEVDTIVILSDGQPTEGDIVAAPDILADIKHRNRLRNVVIHCVALEFQSELLKGLAEISGGTYREVR